ncbi:MFS transporter [Fodinicola feengrottensis]|uniref:MFS transporter n=1 Tax=Fodinicola feengrottensis TaxID=435914 RepID=A0ABN2I1F2_9ACTN
MLINAAMSTTSAAGTLVFATVAGAGWGGAPSAAAVAGTAVGAIALTAVTARRGRRTSLLAGYAAGVLGAVLALVGVCWPAPIALLVGMFLLGMANAGALLSRYAAAEWYAPERRGFVLGAIVWAGAIGAVGGPLLLAPLARLVGGAGWPPLAGAFVLAVLATAGAVAAALVVAYRPPPVPTVTLFGTGTPIHRLLGQPHVKVAMASMLTAQVVMVAIMTAAPLDMHMHGDGLGLVGMVLSVHTFGMFALAPLSGWLTDRFGGARVIAASLVTLAASALLVVTSTVEGWPGLPISLFLLGYGWNLAFVGGSGLLVRGRVQADQARVEGLVEAISWGAAAIATLGSTGVLAAGGYVLLSPLAAALLIVPAAFLLLFQPQMVRTIKTSQDRGQQTKTE